MFQLSGFYCRESQFKQKGFKMQVLGCERVGVCSQGVDYTILGSGPLGIPPPGSAVRNPNPKLPTSLENHPCLNPQQHWTQDILNTQSKPKAPKTRNLNPKSIDPKAKPLATLYTLNTPCTLSF